jgi:hypothetical protein
MQTLLRGPFVKLMLFAVLVYVFEFSLNHFLICGFGTLG